MATIKDVAKLAGVGVGTASRVISGKGSFSEAAAARVEAAARQLGFRPSAIARALSLQSTGTIGVFVPDFKGPFYGPLLDAIDWRLLSDAKARTLIAVQQIPYDQSYSYNRLASDLDPYAIGHLMGANPVPLLVPCHRVSRGSELPEVYVGGLINLHTLHGLEAGRSPLRSGPTPTKTLS